jgi:hypothetical protein
MPGATNDSSSTAGLKPRRDQIYDTAGRLTGEMATDAGGATETVSHEVDTEGKPVKIFADPGGLALATVLSRNADGDVTASADPRPSGAVEEEGQPARTERPVRAGAW